MNGVWTAGIVGLEKSERIQETHGILDGWDQVIMYGMGSS